MTQQAFKIAAAGEPGLVSVVIPTYNERDRLTELVNALFVAAYASKIDIELIIVDDNSLVRDLFKAYLNDLGASCEVAADGMSALKKTETVVFDAVVLDLAMPVLGGMEVARRWRAQGKTWRIVGASAHAGPGPPIGADRKSTRLNSSHT